MKTIRYSLTFLGTIEVPDNTTDEEVYDYIREDYYSQGFDFDYVNDVDWSEE